MDRVWGRPVDQGPYPMICSWRSERRLMLAQGFRLVSPKHMGIVARQTTWNTLLTAAGLALGFVNMALLFPRYLDPGEFGLTRLVVSIAIIGAQVAQLGLEQAIIRYMPYFRGRSAQHGGLFRFALLVGTAGASVVIAVMALFHGQFAQ